MLNIDGAELTHEGPLQGRAMRILQFAKDEIDNWVKEKGIDKKDVSILDVGCFDGWVLNMLYKAGYQNLYGLEPRIQNINRGKHLRKILKTDDTAEHYIGTLEKNNMPNNLKFDVVMSFGVIHHLNDIFHFCNLLREKNINGGLLLIETLTLLDELADQKLLDSMEPKDLIYKNRDLEVSLIGVKKESKFTPGSTIKNGTVQIPTRKSLIWLIENSNFFQIKVSNGFEKNNGNFISNTHRRNLSSTLISARAGISDEVDLQVLDIIKETELNNTFGVLPFEIINRFLKMIDSNSEPYNSTLKNEISNIYHAVTKSQFEIIQNLVHSPKTKIQFELAKYKLLKDFADFESLLNLVEHLNDDWRTTYRTFYLLAKFNKNNSVNWKELAQRCNPEFPINHMPDSMFFV